MIELDKNVIVWALFSILFGSLGLASLIGVIRREVYIGGTQRLGFAAVIWGIAYFLIFTAFAAGSILLFKDYGYSRQTTIYWSALVLIVSIPIGFFYEKKIRQDFLAQYEEEDAKNVAFENLPPNIQQILSKDDVANILNWEFEFQLSKNWKNIDEGLMRSFIIKKMGEVGKSVSDESVQAVIKAEEVYLKQIGVLSDKKHPQIKETPSVTVRKQAWPAVVTIIIIVAVIFLGRFYIITRFNDAFFIAAGLFSEKLSVDAILTSVSHYNQLQKDYPNDAKIDDKALMQIAFAEYFWDRGDADRLLAYVQRTKKEDDKFLPAYIIHGDYFLFDKNDYTKALEQYQIAKSINENNPIVNARLGDIYYNYLGEKQKGIDYYKRAIELNPAFGEVYSYFVGIYNQKKEYDKALDAYYKARRSGADTAGLYYNAAVTFKALNKLDEARSAINKSLAKNSRDVDAYILKADIIDQAGDKDKAIAIMEKVVQDYPKAISAFNMLGYLYASKERYQEAISIYQQATNIEADQDSKAIVYENLGLLYHDKTKQFDLAEEAFKNALKYDSTRATIYINLGETYRAKGKLKEAEKNQQMALQLDPQNALAHNNLGYTLAQQGKITEAMTEFNKALEIDPNLQIAKENLQKYQKK